MRLDPWIQRCQIIHITAAGRAPWPARQSPLHDGDDGDDDDDDNDDDDDGDDDGDDDDDNDDPDDDDDDDDDDVDDDGNRWIQRCTIIHINSSRELVLSYQPTQNSQTFQ